MSRYGEEFCDGLYETLQDKFEQSHLTLLEFLATLMKVLSDFIWANEWKED